MTRVCNHCSQTELDSEQKKKEKAQRRDRAKGQGPMVTTRGIRSQRGKGLETARQTRVGLLLKEEEEEEELLGEGDWREEEVW